MNVNRPRVSNPVHTDKTDTIAMGHVFKHRWKEKKLRICVDSKGKKFYPNSMTISILTNVQNSEDRV